MLAIFKLTKRHLIVHSGGWWICRGHDEKGRCKWPVSELFKRRPKICKTARHLYKIEYPKGIPEGTAYKNCECSDCAEAWLR